MPQDSSSTNTNKMRKRNQMGLRRSAETAQDGKLLTSNIMNPEGPV